MPWKHRFFRAPGRTEDIFNCNPAFLAAHGATPPQPLEDRGLPLPRWERLRPRALCRAS